MVFFSRKCTRATGRSREKKALSCVWTLSPFSPPEQRGTWPVMWVPLKSVCVFKIGLRRKGFFNVKFWTWIFAVEYITKGEEKTFLLCDKLRQIRRQAFFGRTINLFVCLQVKYKEKYEKNKGKVIGIKSSSDDSQMAHSAMATKLQSDRHYKKNYEDSKTKYRWVWPLTCISHTQVPFRFKFI